LIASTLDEAHQLVELYDADPARVATVAPGVDLDAYRPGDVPAAVPTSASRSIRRSCCRRAHPALKAPDVVLRAAAFMCQRDPALRSHLVVAVVGGPSGTGLDHPEHLSTLAVELGIADIVRFEPPVPQSQLVDWYRAATVTVVRRTTNRRTGRLGIAGMRHPGGRRSGRWAAYGGGRRGLGSARRGHDASTWALALTRVTATVNCVAPCHPAGWSTRAVSPGSRPRPAYSMSIATCWSRAGDSRRGGRRRAVSEQRSAAPDRATLDAVIRETLDDRELTYERVDEGAYLVMLKGEHKLQIATWLVVGDHSLLVEAFFVRRPDENGEEFYKWLLGKNGRMYGMSFSVDHLGDVFLVGHLPLAAVNAGRARPVARLRADLLRRELRPRTRDRLRELDPQGMEVAVGAR